jgi:hypothetical protein
MTFFRFDQVSGKLTQLPGESGCFTITVVAGCTTVPGNGAHDGRAVFAPDGLNLYSDATGSLVNIAIDAAPSCQPVAATVPQDTTTTIQLSCSDPNGDPVNISATPSNKGALLGAVNQVAQTVPYHPAPGFTGTDSFTYIGTAKGVAAAPATVTITVLDTVVSLAIAGKVKVDVKGKAKGKAKVKVTCPATEAHGPCTGTLKLKTRTKVHFGGKKAKVKLGSATYQVPAGSTRKVVVKLSDKILALVTKNPDARKILVVAKVKDTAGNSARVKQKATLKLT